MNAFSQDIKSENGGSKSDGAAGGVVQNQLDNLTQRMDDMARQFQTFLSLHSGLTPHHPSISGASNIPVVSSAAGLPATSPMVTSIPVTTQASTVTTATTVSMVSGAAGVASTTGIYTPSPIGFPGRPLVSTGVMNYPPAVSSSSLRQPVHFSVQPTPTPMAPAGWLADPLTSALQQLSNAVDPDAITRIASMVYRPQYYVQHCLNSIPLKTVDHKKMSYRSLIYGMVCVAKYVASIGGNVESYLSHMEFLTRHACDNSYTDVAYAKYDHNVVDQFVKSPSLGFAVADPVALGFSFHPAKLVLDTDAKQSNSVKRKKNSGRQGKSGIPDDYPPMNCYYWNYKSCWNNNCIKQHTCRICEGPHRAVGCPRDKQ